ncbi:uncharacterized protein [Mytilus edulis]|uniref:uncharacterized protein n=1 Tax=Mytilus edulis TaxID=6550 RepID=UPI0039EFC3C7
MKCMYCLFGLFLLVLIVSSSAEINWQKEAGDEKNNIGQEPKLERRRRGLYPGNVEYSFFLHYFEAIGRVPEYLQSITKGVANWSIAFGGNNYISYDSAIEKVADYYIDPTRRVERKDAIRTIDAIISIRKRYGLLDANHQHIVDVWTDARRRLFKAQ